jgi:hypothetical protein
MNERLEDGGWRMDDGSGRCKMVDADAGSCYDVHLAEASDSHVLILEATGRAGTVGRPQLP